MSCLFHEFASKHSGYSHVGRVCALIQKPAAQHAWSKEYGSDGAWQYIARRWSSTNFSTNSAGECEVMWTSHKDHARVCICWTHLYRFLMTCNWSVKAQVYLSCVLCTEEAAHFETKCASQLVRNLVQSSRQHADDVASAKSEDGALDQRNDTKIKQEIVSVTQRVCSITRAEVLWKQCSALWAI